MSINLEIRALGRFEIRLDGQIVDLPSRPAQSLLAYLALTAGVAHRRERLAGLWWPDSTDSNARGYLRQTLWRLRKALEHDTFHFFVADDLTIAFDPQSTYWLDAGELIREVPVEASLTERLQQVSLYQGELLPGFQEEWVFAERQRLLTIYEEKMTIVLDRLVVEQQWSSVLEWSQRWIALGQTPEPAYRALMKAHFALGQMASVVSVYQRCVEALQTDLAVEPSETTRTLYEHLLKGESPAAHSARPPWSPPTLPEVLVQPGNLPQQLTSFIGREREVVEVQRLLKHSTSRLVTLIGTGGCGKTRLAIRVGQELLTEFPEGVWFVELAPLADPTLVPQTVASTLGLDSEAIRPILATLSDYLRTRKSLVILDNCEHLIEASAHLAEDLLHSCPDLHIIASSREALGISGETVFRVPSLSTPVAAQLPTTDESLAYEAVRLFVERAALTLPGFELTSENAPAIIRICQRLDGIPLAIELAAARVSTLRVEQIAARLDNRFRLLTGGSRTALPRQQTLRSLIDWSYGLLGESERILLRRLSVFAGGWVLEAAEAVGAGGDLAADSILDVLTQLVNKSLVMVERETGVDARYRLLETIRQYASEKLLEADDGEATRQQHLAYYLHLGELAELELTGPQQALWLNRLEEELDNVRVALEWAMGCDVEAGLKLAAALVRFWDARGHTREGVDWLAHLSQSPNASAATGSQAKALATRSVLLVQLSQLVEARALAEQSLNLFRAQADRAGEALGLLALGQVYVMQGEVTQGLPLLEESLTLYRKGSDKLGQADVMSWLSLDHQDSEQARALLHESLRLNRELGHLAGIAGSLTGLAQQVYWERDYETSIKLLEEALAIQCQLGSKSGVAWIWESYGNLAYRQNDFERAQICYEHSITLMEAAGQSIATLWARANLGLIALRQGETAKARALLLQSIQRFREAEMNIGVVYGLEGLASLAQYQDQPRRSVSLYAWADAMRSQIGDVRPLVEQADVDRDLALLRTQVTEDEFRVAWSEGQALTMEQALALAREAA